MTLSDLGFSDHVRRPRPKWFTGLGLFAVLAITVIATGTILGFTV